MKITPHATFTHDVTVMSPIDGGFEEETLKVTFNYLDADQVAPFNLKTALGTDEFLKAAVVKLDGLTDANGPVSETPSLREKLLKRTNVRQAVCSHYFNAVAKVKEGN